MTGSAQPWLTVAVAAVQIVAITWLLARKQTIRIRFVLATGLLGIAAALTILRELPVHAVGFVVAVCCNVVVYSSLLIWFGTSLRADREPVVTTFARRLRQTMPDRVARYTRRVTVAWCVFFVGQLAGAAALLILAPASVWSNFMSLLNVPLVAIMALAEFCCRLIVFRHEPRTSLIDMLSALRHVRLMPANRP